MLRTTLRLGPIALAILTLGVLALLAPAAAQADGCTATRTCSDGSTVSCSGNSSCILGSNYVECDGQRTTCATNCSVNLRCPCSNGYSQEWVLFCTASNPSESCSTGFDSVTCGSTTRTCSDCENGTILCLSAGSCSGSCNQGAPCFANSQCGNGRCTALGQCDCQIVFEEE